MENNFKFSNLLTEKIMIVLSDRVNFPLKISREIK